MPTISQLPAAASISAADELPISQRGSVCAVSVGELLALVQPAIEIGSQSLLGRISLGSGTPEQIDVGTGINLSNGTLIADGLDHAAFPLVPSLPLESELVISNQGTPMLMQTSLLRGLFSAGPNVVIDPTGVISSSSMGSSSRSIGSGHSIGSLEVTTSIFAADLVAISQSGSDYAIAYDTFLDGITIDEAQAASSVSDSDSLWVAQGSNIMTRQTFGALWSWIAGKLSAYRASVSETSTNTSLNTTVHNGCLLICSQPITIFPPAAPVDSGFQCTVMNVSSGNVTMGSGFTSSSGSLILGPWQSAVISCFTYSAGTIIFAAMPSASATATLPGQVSGLASSAVTSTSITVSWQAPITGGFASSYSVLYRLTGTTAWTGNLAVVNSTSCTVNSLQPATTYDFIVEAQNASGTGTSSSILSAPTSKSAQVVFPPQVSGLTTSAISTNSVTLNWSLQTGVTAATTYTVQYRIAGSGTWISSSSGTAGSTSMVLGLKAATNYEFTVFGINLAGNGPTSSVVAATTAASSQSVLGITWNLAPSGNYTRGSGAIGVNAHVSPAASPIQFGFSSSTSTAPSSWTAAIQVNSDLWGAYLPTPTTPGNWYAWAEGLDGSAPSVSASPFSVQ